MNSLPPSVLRARILLRSVAALPGAEERIYRRVLAQPAQAKSHNTLGLKLAIITAGVVSAGSMAYGLGLLPRAERPLPDVVVAAQASAQHVSSGATRRLGRGAASIATGIEAPSEPTTDASPATSDEPRSSRLDPVPSLAIAPPTLASPIAPTAAAAFAAGDAPLAPETELGPSDAPRAPESELSRQIAAYREAMARFSAAPASALEKLEQHRRSWPDSAIAHEVELRIIQTLVALGRNSDAQAAAQRFLRRYPNSPQATAVQRIVASGSRSQNDVD